MPARKLRASCGDVCHDIADLVGSGSLEDVIRVVGVAELALILPYVTGADEIMAHGDVHQKIGLSHADAEIGRLPSCNHLIQNLQHEHYGRGHF